MAAASWKSALLTEAHPKALLAISTAARDFVKAVATDVSNDHEHDAALAALTALNFSSSSDGWHDLAKLELAVHHPVGQQVAYWFPRTRA